MERLLSERAQQQYDLLKIKLLPKQVLVPRYHYQHAKPELGEGRYGRPITGVEIIGWRLRNIRRLTLPEIESVMLYGGDQITNEKLDRLIARENRLKEMYQL